MKKLKVKRNSSRKQTKNQRRNLVSGKKKLSTRNLKPKTLKSVRWKSTKQS